VEVGVYNVVEMNAASNEIKECFETSNLLWGIPGKFWRVNDENANTLVCVRKYPAGKHGPEGWYIDSSPNTTGLIYLGSEEVARDHITAAATAHMLKSVDVVIRL
jgi:hypothetical protein